MQEIPFFLERFALDLNADERSVRRAYARELKLIDQEQDAEGFQSLRRCYEFALHWVKNHAQWDDDLPASDEIDGRVADRSPEVSQAEVTCESPSVPFEKHNTGGSTDFAESPAQLMSDAMPDAQSEVEPGNTAGSEDEIRAGVEAVVNKFLEEFYMLAAGSAPVNVAVARELLRSHLADPRMDALESRDLAEAYLASLLIHGWKRGHEALLPTAMMEFGWNEDRRRLEQLGQAGAILNQALGERDHFFAQNATQAELQRRLIETLRSGLRPSDHDLVKYAELVAGMERRYPNWFRIILAPESVAQWGAWEDAVPGGIRRNVTVTKLDAVEVPEKKGGSYWYIGLIIWVVFQLIKFIGSNS